MGDDVVDAKVPALKQLIDVYEKTGSSVLGVQEVPLEKVSSYGIVASHATDEPRTFTVSDMVEKTCCRRCSVTFGCFGTLCYQSGNLCYFGKN